MKLGTVTAGGQQLTVASAGGGIVHDVSSRTGTQGLVSLLTSPEVIAGLDLADYPVIDVQTAVWLPPVPKPDKIFCVGLNYGNHAAEVLRDVGEHPTLFTRFPSSFVGHGQPLVRPAVSHTLDWEGEIVVVVGRGGRNIPARHASDHIAGYSAMGENSIREWQLHSRQATAGKNFDQSGSWGPWILTADEIPDPTALEVVTELNGSQVQHGTLSDLVFDIGEVVAYISTIAELAPGDVIATGTPSGIGHRQNPPRYLAPGDTLTIRIPGLLELHNPIVDAT